MCRHAKAAPSRRTGRLIRLMVAIVEHQENPDREGFCLKCGAMWECPGSDPVDFLPVWWQPGSPINRPPNRMLPPDPEILFSKGLK